MKLLSSPLTNNYFNAHNIKHHDFNVLLPSKLKKKSKNQKNRNYTKTLILKREILVCQFFISNLSFLLFYCCLGVGVLSTALALTIFSGQYILRAVADGPRCDVFMKVHVTYRKPYHSCCKSENGMEETMAWLSTLLLTPTRRMCF